DEEEDFDELDKSEDPVDSEFEAQSLEIENLILQDCNCTTLELFDKKAFMQYRQYDYNKYVELYLNCKQRNEYDSMKIIYKNSEYHAKENIK
ncbi:5736_t:CDS:2, partial [Racocetra fulgida]